MNFDKFNYLIESLKNNIPLILSYKIMFIIYGKKIYLFEFTRFITFITTISTITITTTVTSFLTI